ncbi:hypothetical protein C5167_004799 [Papaver somniferum]|uniref:Uncharacterized protein n=1 Tax=Papaver somniferum TaxID=3469 RepID=A0A4Y7JBQ4_PAPSO|nr:hypothetical protein C5167_004799 [Papaver somniferum]
MIYIFRCAVVTGGNKGFGFEICRQLASSGISVMLTSRDVTKGLEALEKLKTSFGLSNVVFHQLDLTNPISPPSLAEFIKSHFGKLDILVNNAGILGAITDEAGFMVMLQDLEAMVAPEEDQNKNKPNLKEVITETYELAEQCVQKNYFGVKSVTRALIPLLQLSGSQKIVNVTSTMGMLEFVSNENALEILSDGDGLKEESVDMFVKDFKGDILESKGWPSCLPAYTVSKASLNAYTRILAKQFPTFRVNCPCPGWVKTDICFNSGVSTTTEAAERIVNLALVPDDGPTGLYFSNGEVTLF